MSEDSKQEPAADLDDWGSALAEQALASAPEPAPAPVPPPPAPAPPSTPAGERGVQPLQGNAGFEIAKGDIDRVLDVPVELTAELGRTRITIKSLLQLSQGSVVELDGLAGQPMDVFINGYLIAQGEVVVVNDKFGIRLTDIITPSERMQKLNR